MSNGDPGSSSADEDPAHKFGRTLESSLIGVIDFIARYFRTIWNTLLRPSRVIADLTDPSEPRPYSRPFTFLVLSCLIGGVALAHTELTPALFGRSIIASVESAFQFSSPWSILQKTLPIVLAVIVASLIITPLAFDDTSGLRGAGVKLLCICSGCQLVLAILSSIFLTGYAWWKKIEFRHGIGEEIISDTENIAISIVVLVLSLIALLGAAPAAYTLIQAKQTSQSTIIRLRSMFQAILVSFVLFVAASVGAGSSGTLSAFKTLDQAAIGHLPGEAPNSVILSGTVSKSLGSINLSLLIMNQEDYAQILKPSVGSFFELALGLRFSGTPRDIERNKTLASVASWEGGEPVVRIEPNKSAWFEIHFNDNEHVVSIIQELLATRENPESIHALVLDFDIPIEGATSRSFYARGNGSLQLTD